VEIKVGEGCRPNVSNHSVCVDSIGLAAFGVA
jgi:hypothetical protein